MPAKTFTDVMKFNPYHDARGRFTSAGSEASFTYAPGKSKAHDLAIERHKERMAAVAPTEAQEKTLKAIESRTRNLKKEQFRVVDRDGNVVMQKQGDKNSVSYSVGEARDNFPGNITIHNHPDGGTFSAADLSDIGYGATEIRAASPEGTYSLRNLSHRTKWTKDQKNWVDMQEDLETASQSFKSDRQLKKELRGPYEQQVKPLADRWAKRKDEGASQEELTSIAKEYTKAWDAMKPQLEQATRKAYVEQYHHWYKANAGKYGFEYTFTPTKEKTRKSYTMENIYEIDEIEKSSGDIILDRKMKEDVDEIVADILSQYPRELDQDTAKSALRKSTDETNYTILKTDDDKRLVFGWASISITVDGEQLEDRQKDMIDPEDLEEAAYEYVLNFRDTGEEHIQTMRKKGKLVESCVFTAEKQKAIGIPEGTLPIGWWIGFKIEDDAAWERVKNGTYRMFSIEGKANRVPVEKAQPNYDEFPSYDMWLEENLDATIEEQRAAAEHFRQQKTVAKTFDEILKFNPYHDARGRFASANSYAQFTIRTKDPKKQHMADMAIAREKERHAAAAAVSNPTNDPDTVAGVKRGSPMTHEQADEGRGNPHYEEAREYRNNCQSCVVAYEARLRGYDVEAQLRSRDNEVQNTLARKQETAWVDPKTGKNPTPLVNDPSIRTSKQTQKWLDQNTENDARYQFSHGWKGTNGRYGHVVSVSKDSKGVLSIFDPQSGKMYTGDAVTEYMGQVKSTYSIEQYSWKNRSGIERVPQGRLRLLRVDNMQISADVANAVLKEAK